MNSNALLIVIVLLTLSFCSTESASLQGKKLRKLVREEQIVPGFKVRWEIENQTITFDIQANTTGFVGLGFPKNGTLTGADIVMGGVDDKNNSAYLNDMFSAGFGRPTKDAKQDYTLLNATQGHGATRLRFYRDLITGDPFDADIKLEETYFFWAMGISDNSSYYESTRGRYPVNILAEHRNATRKQNVSLTEHRPSKRRGIYKLGSILKVLLTYIDYTQEYVVKMLSFERTLTEVMAKTQ